MAMATTQICLQTISKNIVEQYAAKYHRGIFTSLILLLVVFASGNTTYRIKINPVNNVIGNVIIMAAMCGLMAMSPK